jgi:hypothetical protein
VRFLFRYSPTPEYIIEAWKLAMKDQRAVLFDDNGRPIASVNMPLSLRVERTRQRGLEMDFG